MCDHRVGRFTTPASEKQRSNAGSGESQARDICPKCGAKRIDRQIGQEPDPDSYVQTMVEVFREVRRVLHDSGTVWLNVGDSYCSTAPGTSMAGNPATSTLVRHARLDAQDAERAKNIRPATPEGMKPKDLCMIPWRLAIALQADGWWVRSIICWAKKSCMPESVTDRPTNSWEPIFLLAKSAKYFYDAEAVKEPAAGEAGTVNGNQPRQFKTPEYQANRAGHSQEPVKLGAMGIPKSGTRNQRNVWNLGPEPYAEAHFATFPTEIPRRAILAGTSARGCCPKCYAPWVRKMEAIQTGRGDTDSKLEDGIHERSSAKSLAQKRQAYRALGMENPPPPRTVGWEPGCECDGIDRRIVSSPTGERAGDDPSLETGRAGMNRPRGSAEGQRPITRYEQAQYAAQLKASTNRKAMEAEAGEAFAHYVRTDDSGARPIPAPLLEAWIERGWLARVTIPDTEPLAPIPCTVLDPFGGSGTSGAVANELGRHAILCELSPEYAKLIETRTQNGMGLALH